MTRLKLTLACREYQHIQPLIDRSVTIPGIDLDVVYFSSPSEMFKRIFHHEEFDVCEFSLANYLSMVAANDSRLVMIPVFPSRAFRHSSIWINSRSGIEQPIELKEKRVGIPSYGMTALLFARGVLQHEYGVSAEDIQWIRARKELVPLNLPERIRLKDHDSAQPLDALLGSGEIDALISTGKPAASNGESPGIRRLFHNSKEIEADYYRKTKIFPIMHIIAIRRPVYEKYRFVAQALTEAFQEAKVKAYERVHSGSFSSLPWSQLDLEFIESIFGQDPLPYGVRENLSTLQAAVGFAHDQALTRRKLKVEELFAQETLN